MADNTIHQTAYVPGVCNINRAEIAYRRKTGYWGLAIFAAIAVILTVVQAPAAVFIILLAPAFIAAIGFLQAKNKFCVAYGANGKQNATPGSQAAQSVTDQVAIAKDKLRARRLNLQALTIAVVATASVLVVALVVGG
jgi:hypothetical protein